MHERAAGCSFCAPARQRKSWRDSQGSCENDESPGRPTEPHPKEPAFCVIATFSKILYRATEAVDIEPRHQSKPQGPTPIWKRLFGCLPKDNPKVFCLIDPVPRHHFESFNPPDPVSGNFNKPNLRLISLHLQPVRLGFPAVWQANLPSFQTLAERLR